MSTSSELKEREIKSRESIADKDRSQKERSDKRAARASFYGSAVKSLGSVIGKMNDVSFYTKLVGASKVNASIPDFQILGFEDLSIDRNPVGGNIAVPAVVQVNYGPTIGNTTREIRGAAVVNTIYGQDSMNRALNRVCTQLEQRNSRVLSYSRDTVGRYLFIVTDIAVDINNLKVALDAFDMADSTKPFVARQIIRAKGFNYLDFKSNISAYRSMYVSLVEDFNTSLPIPADLTFMKRQLWLSNTIVRDMKSDYCSYLVFNKCIKFTFEPSPSSEPDVYYAMVPPTGGETYSTYITGIKRRIQYLVNGASWKPLIRDIRGGTKSNLWLKLPSEADKKSFVFSDVDEVRSQLHNMNVLPVLFDVVSANVNRMTLNVNSFNIWGDSKEAVRQGGEKSFMTAGATASTNATHITPGTVLWKCNSQTTANTVQSNIAQSGVYHSVSVGSSYSKDYIYSQLHSAKPEEALVATRFKMGWTSDIINLKINTGESGYSYEAEGGPDSSSVVGDHYYVAVSPFQYGTEIVCSIKIMPNVGDDSVINSTYITAQCVFSNLSGSLRDLNGVLYLSTEYADTGSEYSSSITGIQAITLYKQILGELSTLDWMPLITISGLDTGTSDTTRVFGELDHYTVFASDVMGKLHSQCIESEFTLSDDNYLPPLG